MATRDDDFNFDGLADEEIFDEQLLTTSGLDEVGQLGEAFGLDFAPSDELVFGKLERDRHRWELDPASSEDFVERNRRAPGALRWRHFNH